MLKEMQLPADKACFDKAIAFIEEALEAAEFSPKDTMLVLTACEEVIVNIMNYAYPDHIGDFLIGIKSLDDGIDIILTDSGQPFNPLIKPDPGITLSAAEREIGGLGIFMVKKIMDEVVYRREDEKNILTLMKRRKRGWRT